MDLQPPAIARIAIPSARNIDIGTFVGGKI